MPSRKTNFINGGYYHIFNRGVDKRDVFLDDSDFKRFLEIVAYYQFAEAVISFSIHKNLQQQLNGVNKLVEVVCYCLMPNHFHFTFKQNQEFGISSTISKIINSYTKYFNKKYDRSGYLFSGEFKAVEITSDEQLIHLSRYIHLNPYVAGLVDKVEDYKYSSYREYRGIDKDGLCNPQHVLDFFKNKACYESFVNDYKNQAKKMKALQKLGLTLE